MHQVRKAKQRLNGIVLVAFSIALLFLALAATQQSRCRMANKACGCDSPVIDANRFASASAFTGISAALSVQLSLDDLHVETPALRKPVRAVSDHGTATSVGVLALAPKTSPPVLCA